MGEVKRKAQRQAERGWAKGVLKIVANGVECFRCSGTRQEASDLQRGRPAAGNKEGTAT